MKLGYAVRRTHLYLALGLLPWFLMYGVSSLPFNHSSYFSELFAGDESTWIPRFEAAWEAPAPDSETELRAWAADLMEEHNLEGSFGVYRNGQTRINIYIYSFWSSTRLIVDLENSRLIAEDRRFRWNEFLTGMHARGGYQQESLLSDLWAVMVDLVSLGFLVWVATGLYMWWKLPGLKLWGGVALASGFLTFALFLLSL